MSNSQIHNLPVAISLSGEEMIEIVQAGVSRRTTVGQVSSIIALDLAPDDERLKSNVVFYTQRPLEAA